MGRILFFLILGLLIALGVYTTRAQKIKKEQAAERLRQKKADERVASEPMVRCAHCGLYVPRSEALAREGNYFCCAEHRDAGPR